MWTGTESKRWLTDIEGIISLAMTVRLCRRKAFAKIAATMNFVTQRRLTNEKDFLSIQSRYAGAQRQYAEVHAYTNRRGW
jgi:hypothetical protein